MRNDFTMHLAIMPQRNWAKKPKNYVFVFPSEHCPKSTAQGSRLCHSLRGKHCEQHSFQNKTRGPTAEKQLRSFAWSLYCDNLSGSNLEIMNYISRKSCSLLISGSGTRFVVYETIENGVITLYKSIRAFQLCTMCFPKQIKWRLW